MTTPAILLTGGAGYIGSHTAFLLAQQGYQVIILDTLAHKQAFQYPWATLIHSDYADQEILHNIFTRYSIVAVMHFAACIEVGASVIHPALYYENNVVKTIILLNTMLHHGISKIIFSSSCAIYGEPQHLPLTEDHPKNPLSPYGKTKLMVEMILQDFAHAYALKYVSLRYFNAGGALPEEGLGEQHQPETHIIPLLLHAALEHTPFKMFGNDYPTKDGSAIRDYIHVRDIAQAHIAALQHLQQGNPSDNFNLGTGNGISVKEMIETVERVTHNKIKIIVEKRRSGDSPLLIADPTKANTILRWHPRYSDLDFIIKSAYAFYIKHAHFSNKIYELQ